LHAIDESYISETSLRLPLKIVKRGRPKGAETTVIGLPKRKSSRAIPFMKRAPKHKERGKHTTLYDAMS
jgi:hypothetical protein